MGLLSEARALWQRWRGRRTLASYGSALRWEGGDGSSREEAIVIRGATFDLAGTLAEFVWVKATLGEAGRAWTLVSHSHGTFDGDREIDTIVVRLASGEERAFHFDITESFGKWPGESS